MVANQEPIKINLSRSRQNHRITGTNSTGKYCVSMRIGHQDASPASNLVYERYN